MKSTTNVMRKTHADRKPKSTSGSYNRLYGDPIGNEMTKGQSNSIADGTALEKRILEHIENETFDFYKIQTRLDYDEVMKEFNSCRISDDTFDISDRVYLMHKSIFKDIKHGGKGIQPDLLVLLVKNGKITFFVFELKIGDHFDTKKNPGEKVHLISFVEQLNVITGINKVYKIIPFFSELSKNKLSKEGFKNVFGENEILTREELNELFETDFDVIIKEYDSVRDINETQFVDGICMHHSIQRKILMNPNIQNCIFDFMDDILDDTQKRKLSEKFNRL